MRNITFSADKALIQAARERARAEGATLNDAFRRWLASYARGERQADDAMTLIDEVGRYARTGGRIFSRDQLNER